MFQKRPMTLISPSENRETNSIYIERVRFECRQINKLQNIFIGRGQHHRWRTSGIESLQPAVGADAPLITGP